MALRACPDYVSFLLLIIPVAIVAGELGWDPTTVFILNFFTIIPLAAVLSFATEETAIRLGETLVGLLNATFGNAVELVVRPPFFFFFLLHLQSVGPACATCVRAHVGNLHVRLWHLG